MDSFDGFDKKSISDVDSLPLFIRFIDFSSSMFEVLNPNYSNSLDFHDQESFWTQECDINNSIDRSKRKISGSHSNAQLSMIIIGIKS